MIKSRVLAFVIFVVVFLVVGNLLDWAFVTFITRGTYHFSLLEDVAAPITLALLCGYFTIGKTPDSHR